MIVRYSIVLIIGVIIGALLRKPEVLTKLKKYEVVSVKTDTAYISHEKTVFKKGEDIYHDTTIYVELPPIAIDTQAILSQYFAKNIYKDTLLIDSVGYVAVMDTISQNRIENRVYSANIKERIITKETILRELPKNHIYLGISTIGPGILYTGKKNIALNLASNGKKHIFAFYYKIK